MVNYMNLKEKNILVTGAGGFIGSHLVETLVREKMNVTAFLKYNSRNDWGNLEFLDHEVLEKITVVLGNLRDIDSVTSSMKNMDFVIHLGALISIPYSYQSPRGTVETNILGTLNVLTSALKENVELVIHTSTSEVYGTAKYVPMDETHPLQAQSPYSASKIGADKIVESFYKSFDLPVVTLRPFNTYGPRQSARAVIPTIITQALQRNHVNLGSLHPTRDFTFVKDVTEAFVLALKSKNCVGEVINVGSNFEISIGDLIKKIFDITNKNIEIRTEESRIRPEKSEVERLWCDNAKAKKLLRWAPETTIDDGLKKTVEWISENLSLYKRGYIR